MGVVVAYYGGRVLSNAAIVAVFWTSNVDVDLQQQLGSFYSAIAASSYVDWLEEYDTLGLTGAKGQLGSNQHIGRGQFAGAYTITPSTASVSLDNGQIASELASQIAAGALPAPTLDSAGNVNTLYMIELPPGYTVTLSGATSCADFCAYHWTASIGGKSVPYAVFPDSHACAGAVCGQGFDDETILRSHEMAEAITDVESGLVSAADVAAGNDVYPMAWSGDGGAKGEIGDLLLQLVRPRGLRRRGRVHGAEALVELRRQVRRRRPHLRRRHRAPRLPPVHRLRRRRRMRRRDDGLRGGDGALPRVPGRGVRARRRRGGGRRERRPGRRCRRGRGERRGEARRVREHGGGRFVRRRAARRGGSRVGAAAAAAYAGGLVKPLPLLLTVAALAVACGSGSSSGQSPSPDSGTSDDGGGVEAGDDGGGGDGAAGYPAPHPPMPRPSRRRGR